MSAEPTAEQRAAAAKLVQRLAWDSEKPLMSDAIAHALAAAVTAEREKYLRVADELELEADANLDARGDGLHRAVERIREVTT